MAAAKTIVETHDEDSILLGLGQLGLAALPRTSPDTYDGVGYIKGASFTYSRELKDFESGGVLIKRTVYRDRFSLSADWAEVNITNLNRVFQGTVSGIGNNTINFGGGRAMTRFAARFEHERDDGNILQIDMFKCAPSGEFALAFQEEDFVTYTVQMDAEADSDMAAGQRYGRIRLLS